MDKQPITIEPELIQIGPQQKQLIKIINRTSEQIDNCFFCLFNTNKFDFSPDSFALQPREHKLVTVTLKLKVSEWQSKEFAYLKAKGFNKRVTLVGGTGVGVGAGVGYSAGEGVEDINTMSSRDYRETQKLAYERIISQKQAYILKLQRKLQQTSHSLQQESLNPKPNKLYLDQIQTLQLQTQILARQKQQVVLQNLELHQKFKEYRITMESDGRMAQLNGKLADCARQMKSQAEEIKFLELQCQQFLAKIQEKEGQIRDSQFLYASKIDGIIKEGEKKLQEMELKIQEERKQTEKVLKSESAQLTERLNQKVKSVESELTKKDKQIKSLQTKLSKQQSKAKQLYEESKRIPKLEQEKEKLAQKNRDLKEKLAQVQRAYQSLKDETIIYKNKLSDQDESTEKMHQYLEMALASSKNQNQILKKSKQDVENLLAEEGKSRRFYESKVQGLEQSIRDLAASLKEAQEEKDRLQREKLAEKEESHDKIMQLKSENIDLLEKISLEKRRENERNAELQELREMVPKVEKELQRAKDMYRKLEQDYRETVDQKEKIEKKIQKYRKETKKSIKSISDNAKDELKRIEEQKNKLTKKVEQLQISALNTENPTHPQSRLKTRTHYEEQRATQPLNSRDRHPMSVEGDRKIGIRNQRRELEESQVNSRSEIDMDKVYGELGQLREFRNYVWNQIRKLRGFLGGERDQRDENVHGNSIFQAINFFKDLEQGLQSRFGSQQKLFEAQKEIGFLKGRLAELQPMAKTLKSGQKQDQLSKFEFDRNAIEYIREQMKAQYKKLYDSLKLSEQKYEILRKKIYEEYRSRIIDLISKKDRDEYTVAKIEAVLERFVDGLGNTSHKEAVLAKEVKLKQEARKEASLYKDKLAAAVKTIEGMGTKKGNTCVREPVRVFEIQNDSQWLDSVRLEAKALTLEAQNARLVTEKDLCLTKASQTAEQLKLCQADLEIKQAQIEKLKKQVISLSKEYEDQLKKQEEELNSFKKRFQKMQKMQKQISDLTIKEKENNHLREQVQEKRDMIKNLREREKMLEQLLDQSKRNQSTLRDRDRKEYMEESRMQESLKDLKENNRELRAENSRLREQVDGLVEEVNKKNVALKRLKSESEEHRIRASKGETDSIDKVRAQLKELKEEQKRSKEEADKQKRKRDRQQSELQAQRDRLRSEFQIQKSSLQSIIRALSDTIKSIYCSLNIIARKKGKIITDEPNLEAALSNPSEVRTTKIRQYFDDLIEVLKQ